MTDESALHLGEDLDEAGARNGRATLVEPGHLTTHGVILGMTGSGKTGLGIVLLEEALSRGIPALILDPKGDMGNLLLNFPALRPQDFRPWIDEAEAARTKQSPDDLAASTAETWRKGLESWGTTPDDMRRLGMNARFTIFTPGSTAGVPLDVVGSLRAPDAGLDSESRADEIEGFTSGLLALVNRTGDPLSSADHILISNLIARAWDAGQSLDLPALVAQIANPPIRKLGVFDLDTFMPPKDRMSLAVQLNALLASPSFAPWMRGVPLDMQRMLFDDDNRPRAAILYLAHLSEPERQFIVTLAMSRMVGWMRTQPGTSDLRALIYMDEVAGFAPPTAQPPSKKPILTILKQGRAHGIGMVLSTQNPVDLDYKAMSNAGTWMIGRLQTERDKARILEGMRSAAGNVDIDALDTMIGALGKRQFLLHTARGGAPRRFTTRWAMSFLRGPLTRIEIERLMQDDPDRSAATGMTSAGDASAESAASAGAGAAGGSTGRTATVGVGETTGVLAGGAVPAGGSIGTAGSQPDTLRADEVTIPPDVASGVPVRYLDAAVPWATEIGAHPGSPHLEAAIAARVHLRYDDTAAGVDHTETWECILFPLTDPARPEDARVVDYDERDLRADPPPHAAWALPQAPIDKATYFRTFGRQLEDYLHRTRTTDVLANGELKLYSRVGESREEFIARCRTEGAARADADAAKLRDRVQTKLDRLEKQQRTAEDRVRELTVDSKQRVQQEIVAGAGQLLSMFLGGRRNVRALSGVASRRGITRRTQERLDTAQGRVEDVAEEMKSLEAELADELVELQEKWDACAENIETRTIPLEKNDIHVAEVVLLWVPVE
ncbi:MAG TPA: DUF87 domain-containing protein [Longimicrobiales bacterium]|nr:DUF87 domain-containing protein [Longimicrobiales bacterium]